MPEPTESVRLAELLAVLSLLGDLGLGLPMEHALRQSVVALRLGDRLGLGAEAREALYYTGLLAWVGCHVDAYEQAKWFGDDLALKAGFRDVDLAGRPSDMAFVLRHLGAGRPPGTRARTFLAFPSGGYRYSQSILTTHWLAVDELAAQLGLDGEVRKSIEQTFERWDGRGQPAGARHDEILVTSRLVNLADVVEVFHRQGGVAAAVAVARARSGTQFDPAIVVEFCTHAAEILADLDSTTTWETVLAAEPGLGVPLTAAELDAALEAIADFTDAKSPYTLGHSRRVADLAGAAAHGLQLPPGDVAAVRRAGLLHDLGRLGVSNAIWDKKGSLTIAEAERIRLHPYLTERTLASCPALARLGTIAVQHHERLDGSGYPGGLRAGALTLPGQTLAAADVYQAKREPRPHRPEVSAQEAAAFAREEVRAGRLDGDAVEAVLRAAGHASRRRAEGVAGLTRREVEVLRLLARGRSVKDIAAALHITRKTAANHVEHIYTKIGVNNRALASLFATRHGLVEPEP